MSDQAFWRINLAGFRDHPAPVDESGVATVPAPPGADAFVRTGPGTLAGRYLRRFWHPVYVGADLPAGRAVPADGEAVGDRRLPGPSPREDGTAWGSGA